MALILKLILDTIKPPTVYEVTDTFMNATKLHVHSNTYLQIKQRCKCFLLCEKGANKNHKRRESSDESPINRRSVRLSYRGYKAARITKAGIIY